VDSARLRCNPFAGSKRNEAQSTREKWRGTKYDFYLLAHEHLYMFRKLATGERTSEFKNSVKWR